jgi:signal transduction histidine kinase
LNLRALIAGRTGAPIALQIVGLLAVGLVTAQLVTLGVVLLVPPGRSQDYRLEVVAQALRGGPLTGQGGRPLTRTIEARPPLERGPGWVSLRRTQEDLARILGVSDKAVSVQYRLTPPFAGAAMMRGPGGPPPGSRPWREHRLPPPEGEAGRGRPPHDGGMFPFHAPPMGGDFVAGLQTGTDRWTVVRPQAEGFPNSWQRRLLLWFAVAFAVVGPVGYLFARRLVAPLAAFAEAAERLGRDPRAPPMTLSGPAEIGRAARAFNEMQIRLGRYVEDRTAMVGAISHDLRTPLARLRFKLERVEPEARAAMLQDVAQMEAMITSVLDFIRDASEPSRRRRADLRSIVECVVDDAAMLGAEASLATGDPVIVDVDMLAIQRVVTNLVDNAVRYGGAARVGLFIDRGDAVVEIADPGPGLSPAELERVFQPFYRSTPARTLDQGGVGLGLSLSRSIARAHGGEVSLRPGQPGLIAELRLPLAAPARTKPGAAG